MNAPVNLQGYSAEAKKAIMDFMAKYGAGGTEYRDSAYVVTDFDDTVSIFDITYQGSVYQLETLCFAMTPDELARALAASLDLDEIILDYIHDISNAYRSLADRYAITPEGLSEEQLPELHRNPCWLEFAAKMKCLYLYIEETQEDEIACQWITFWCTNMTEEQVYQMFRRACQAYRNRISRIVTWTAPAMPDSRIKSASCTFSQGFCVPKSTVNLLKLLSENGIDIWICSASNAEAVRASVDAFELNGYITGIIGLTQMMEKGRYVAVYDYENGSPYLNRSGCWEKMAVPLKCLPDREGKTRAIQNVLIPLYGCGPLAGFMDSSGDFQFCTEFASLKLVICYNRGARTVEDGAGLIGIAALYQQRLGLDLFSANARGDTLYVFQGRDENGFRSLLESDAAIRCGSRKAKVFEHDENEKLLAFWMRRGFSLAEALNRFAIKTGPEDSETGFAYGYLEEYNGYHSIAD